MSTKYEQWFRDQLEQRAKGLIDAPASAVDLPDELAGEVLGFILDTACTSQNSHLIAVARDFFAKLPVRWVARQLQKAVEAALNTDDEWEFRRLLELLVPGRFRLVVDLIKRGRESANEEVREAANAFARAWSPGVAEVTPFPIGRVERELADIR